MGLVNLFNGMDILQTQDYVKISVRTFIEHMIAKYLATWMTVKDMPDRPTPLPTRQQFLCGFMSAKGDLDEKAQERLADKMGLGYRNGIGKLIYAMITCQPDLSYSIVRLTQYSVCPHEHHFNGLKHVLKYLIITCDD